MDYFEEKTGRKDTFNTDKELMVRQKIEEMTGWKYKCEKNTNPYKDDLTLKDIRTEELKMYIEVERASVETWRTGIHPYPKVRFLMRKTHCFDFAKDCFVDVWYQREVPVYYVRCANDLSHCFGQWTKVLYENSKDYYRDNDPRIKEERKRWMIQYSVDNPILHKSWDDIKEEINNFLL